MNQGLETRLRALITLLGDEDEAIRRVARRELMRHDVQSRPLLEEVARSDAEGRVRIEARALLEESRLNALSREFHDLLHSSEFDLEAACFILARIEYPDLDVPRYVHMLDQLAVEAQMRAGDTRGEKTLVLSLAHFLFTEKGFRGNVESYYDPQNSFINRVLDRHLGIPISLSTLCMFVAKRLQLPLYGVGFPGHFLLQYRYGSEALYIDAFNSGRLLTREDCANILESQGYEFYDSYLAVATPQEILGRMIRNLVLIYHENHQPNRIDALERIFSDFFASRKEEGLS